MKLFLKRKFRILVCYFVAYLCLVAFSLAATNRAPVRNNESMILTDFSTGQELDIVPYGNHSFKMVISDNKVMHAPVNLMSGESFHVKVKAELEGVPEAEMTVDLSADEFDMTSCSFKTVIHEGENEIEGELVFDGVQHPPIAELNVYTTTPGAVVTITKPNFTRIESVKVGYLAYIALALTAFFVALGTIMLVLDRKQAARELRGEI